MSMIHSLINRSQKQDINSNILKSGSSLYNYIESTFKVFLQCYNYRHLKENMLRSYKKRLKGVKNLKDSSFQ
jgi:hypothetical protein